MYLSEFDFVLPTELIAQEPAERGASRLLGLDRRTGTTTDWQFRDLPSILHRGDVLVVNNTRVFAARLVGTRLPGGGAAECMLVRRIDAGRQDGSAFETWEALVHPGQRLKAGSRVEFGSGSTVLHAEVLDRHFHGRRTVRLWTAAPSVTDAIDAIGHVPLPPYIKRPDAPADRERYQTIFACARGSIAAPTAGLHFTPDLLSQLDAGGVERTALTLHVGYGTFQPIRSETVEDHVMEAEFFEVSPEAADVINRARAEGRRVVAVGTTTTRALESLALSPEGHVGPMTGSTNLFITPGHHFRIVSGLVTNFHLPQSSLLLLVSAFAGHENVLAAYRHAIRERYKFYSYGDAMVIL